MLDANTGATNYVEHKVRRYIIDNLLLGNESGLKDNVSLLEAGILDSTGAMELVQFLESNFGIAVEDREISPENLDCVESICAFVQRKQQLSAAA
jgi:acyl carrier protein